MYCPCFFSHDQLLRLQGQDTHLSLVLMLVVWFAVISDNLQSSKHLAHGEEAQDFSKDDADGGHLSGVDVSDAAQERLGVDGVH